MSTYDDIAGFDTSSLGLGAAALQAGQAGIDVANAAFFNLSGAARYANAVALIEAAASDGGVSPVRALLAFVDRLNQLDGDSSHFAAIGAEIAGLVASGSVGAAAAMADFLPAINAYQIGRSEVASIFIAVANAGALDVQLVAGCYYGQIITRGSFEGGEGGGTEGGGTEGGGGGWPGGTLSMSAAVQAIHNAVVGGSLGETQAYAMLAGLMVSPFPAAGFQAMNELRALIGSDTDARDDVIDIFIASVGILPFNVSSSAAGNIMSLLTPFSTPDLSLPELASHVHAAVAAGSVTAEQAIAMMVRFAPSYNSDAIAAANDVATEVLSLVDDGFISQGAALDALTGGDAFTAARFLVAVASVDPDAAPAAGLELATLIDTTTPTFMVPNNMMTAQQALTFINAGVSLGGLSGASAVALLTAMAFVPGGLTSDRNAMNVAADGVRGLLAGTMGGSDAAAAVVGALAPLGFTPAQGITFLLALGASGTQQVFGSSIIWVFNADLSAAASAAIAGLIHDHGLSAAAIGAALDGVFPLGADDVQLAVSTLLRAAPALAVLEPGGFAAIGAALAHAVNVSQGLAMGQLNDRMLANELSDEALIAILAGYAGAGDAADQVAAGRQFNAVVDWTSLSAVDAMVELDAAVAAGALTRGQAIVLLAGTATSSLPDGLADLLAKIAAYMNADPAAGAAALDGAVSANALSVAQGLYVLTAVATLGSAATAAAITDVLLSWVHDGIVTADDLVTQLIGLAQGGDYALRSVTGDNIAALIGDGALTTQDAIALIDAAVPGTLDAHTAIILLAHMAAAGDAALQDAVQLQIASMIGGGDITLAAAIADLQAMLPGASAALQAVLDAELAILLTDPATLAQTAGLGSAAQVQAAANAIALLFSTDPTAAQAILDALADRIQNGDLTPAQAANLLARIYDQGGAAAAPVLATIDDLTPGHIPVSTMADAIVAQATAGGLSAAEIFAVLGPLSAVNAAAVNGAVAWLVSSGVIAVSALDAAVDGGQYTDSNAVAVLRSVVPGAAPALRTDALAEIQALVGANTALAAQALPTFIQLAVSGDHDLRLVGREGIEALAAAAPGVGSTAFLQLLSYLPVPDTAFLTDLRSTLVALLDGGYLTAAQAIQHIDDQLSPGNPSPLINAFQAVDILVELSAVDGARTAIYDYIRQEVAANSAAQAAGPSHPMWPFTAQPVIAALAKGTVADLDHVEQTALVIVNISASLTTNQVVTSLGQGSTALIVLVAGFINRGMAEFGSYLAARVASLPPAEQIGSLDVISTLIGNTVNDLQLSDATELLLAIHAGGAKAAALAELADIGTSASFFIMAAVTSGATTLANGVEVMAALATIGASGFEAAMSTYIGDLLVGGQFTPAAVMSALEAAVGDGALTVQEMVALLQDVLVARLDPTDLPATATLQSAILAEIDALIAAHQITFAEAVTAMASSASGQSSVMLFAIGGEIAAFVGSHPGSESASVAGILAAATGVITGAEALGLLVGEAILGGADLQAVAGGGIAGLVAAGSVTPTAAAIGVYNAYLNSGLSLDNLVAVTEGMWASGGTAVGAEVLYQVASHGFETYGDLADRFAAAVDAGTLSVGNVIDGSVALVLRTGGTEAGADFLSALISEGLLGAGDAVAALGTFISPSSLSATQTISLVGHLVVDHPSAASSFGAGFAALAVAGQLSLSDAAAGLADLLDAGFPGLDFADVAAVLVGAATVAAVAGQAQAELDALIGNDAQRTSDAIDIISDAALHGVLTPAGVVALLVAIAGGGTPEQQVAVGRALDSLVLRSIVDAGTVFATLTAEVDAGQMDGAAALFVLLQQVHDATGAQQAVSNINYLLGHEAVSAHDAVAAVLAAAHTSGTAFASGNAVNVLISLAYSHTQPPIDGVDRAVIVEAGAALADLVANGEIVGPTLLLQIAASSPSAAIPLLVAIEVAAGASVLGQDAHTVLSNTLDSSGQPYASAQSIAHLVGPGGLTAAQGLAVLADIAVDGGVVMQVAVGQEFARLLAEHAVTTADLHAALYVGSVSDQAAAMMLAAMIDADAAAIPVALQELIVSAVRLPAGATSWEPYVQPLIAALANAVISDEPVPEASGLRLGQAVLAISSYARVGDPGVIHDAGVAIAALATFYHATDSVFALLSRALVSDPPYGNLNGRQIAEVGVALGFTPSQTAEAVANGIDHGLAAADMINVLARLTSFDSASFGLVSGAAIAGLTDGQITSTQAMDALLGLTGVSGDNMMLLLAGFAGAGTAADQIAAGRAIAYLPTFDAQLLTQIPAGAVGMVALGIAASGAPYADILLIALSLQSGQDLTPALMAALAAAADAGTLPAADGVRALVYLAVNVTFVFGDEALAMRTALHEELVDLVRDHLSGDVAAGIILTSVPATSSSVDKMRAEAGGMLAALVDAGLASAADIAAALSASLAAGTNTPAAIAAFIAGAALNHEYTNPFPTSHDLAKSLGHTLGELIEAGSVGIADAMAGVAASQSWFHAADYVGEITMLSAVATHDAAGLQVAVGHALAGIYQSGQINGATFIPAFDAMVGTPGGLTAGQATAVLFGMAEGVGFGVLYDIGAEFANLVHRGLTTAQQVADGMTAVMSAGHISAGNGLALLAYFVVADNAFAGAVGGEIAELIRAGGLTQPQTIDGLLGAANAISADLAVAGIIGALVDEDTATYAYAATAIVAAQGAGSLTMGHATAIMISLAETADESGMGFLGVGFGHLIECGLDPVAVQTALSQALQGHLVTAAQAASLVAYVAGAISNLPNADDYHYGMAASILAQTAPEDAVAAFDRAYELGGIDAHDVVSLLTWMHGVAGTFSRWEIGRELWKMFDEGGVALADIFAQVVAHNSASWMQGSLIGAMAATDDASRQITVGRALGEFIADGHMSASDALMGLELTGLSGAQYTMVILSVAGTGGPAAEIDVGAIFGRGLASTPVNASDVDHATIDALDDAVAAGALAVPALVGLLVGMGMAQYPSPYAVRTSIYALDALVTSGRITADAAMTVFDNAATAVVDGAVPWLEMSSLVYWLAVASRTPSLHDAVAAEIVELISDGALSAAQAFDYIRDMIETPLDVADLLAISGNTVANLYVSIAGHGDVGLQDAAGAHLGALPGGPYLSPIDAAVTGGSLSAEGALHVIANLLGALASDSSATVRNWAVSHLDDYVSDGLVAVATVSSVLVAAAEHATTAGLTWIGAVMGGLDLDVAAIHNAIASGDLTAGQGTRLLLGMGADGEGIDATFVAARAEIVALVTAGHVSAAQVLAEAATSSLDQEHLDALAFGLVGHGTATDDAAIAAYFGAQATVFGDYVGRQDDSFFSGVVDEVGLVFAKVQGGQITVAQAIDAIEAYADEHGVSSYAGVYSLNSLFSRYGNGAGVAATNVAMIDKIVIGDLSAELAVRVAEGQTSAWVRDPAGGTHVEAADATAITQQQAVDLLNWEGTRAFLAENVDLVRFMFADDLWVARQVRIDSNPFTPFSMSAVIDAARIGNAYYNTGIQDVGRSAYAYDLALVALVEQVTAADRPADQQDYTIALNALSTRLLNGGAEGALVAQYAAGNLSFDQVLLALDKEVAASALGSAGADREMMHDISLAWLNLSARKYIVQNPGTAGAIEAGQLLQQLGDAQYSDDLLTGFGALLGLSSSGATAVISSLDRQEAYQAAFDTIRARTPATLPLDERDQAVLDVLIPMANGMQFVLERQPLGRALLTVGDDPTDAANYARLGAQVGVIFANKLAVDAMFAGTPWGAAITAAKFGAQVGLFVLSMGAVQDAIGEGPTLYLRGQLTIAGATASLLGDSLSDLGAAGAEIAISSAPHFIAFSDAVAHGDAQGIASSIGELAADYYMLQTGVDPRLYGAVGERFADLIVHLFTGDTGALGDDVRALGSAYLDTILKNPYLAAIGSRMVQYAETINGALQDINDSYRILGENVVTGLLLVGTRLDGAGNAIRDVAHKVGGFFTDILHGIGIDGYISGATVFADANFNGVLDPGEASTTTDATGHYSITSNGAPLILQGGVDTATNLAFTGTMQAPAGSTVVTPLTTLIQKVAASTTGDPVAAQQLVASALGLSSSLDLNDLDTVAATRTGVSGATNAFAAASSVLNTVSLLHAAGSTDAFDALAARIVATNALDLTDSATLLAIAGSAGLAGSVASVVAQLAGASNALTEQAAASATDPMRFLRYVTAVSMAAQGDTAHDLAAAGGDPTQLANVLADHTGTGLSTQVSGNRTQVGGFGDTGTGGGEVPLKISADGHGIELAPNGGVSVAGNWVRLAAQDFGSHAGSTVLVYTVDSSGNIVDHNDDHSGSALTGLPSLGAVGGVENDHGGGMLLGAQSVYLAAGEQLRFAMLSGNQIVDVTPSTQFASRGDGSLQVTVDGLHLTAVTNNSLSDATTLADAQRDTGDAFVFLKHGQTLSVELAGSSANVNTLGFVRIDIDAATGARSVAGVAFGDTAAFAAAVRSHMDGGIHEVHGGDFAGTVSWTVSGDTGYYAPVLITPSGQTFVIGTANPGGHEQIRAFGENTFGFEDLAYNQGSDFDYNDMVMRLKPTTSDHII